MSIAYCKCHERSTHGKDAEASNAGAARTAATATAICIMNGATMDIRGVRAKKRDWSLGRASGQILWPHVRSLPRHWRWQCWQRLSLREVVLRVSGKVSISPQHVAGICCRHVELPTHEAFRPAVRYRNLRFDAVSRFAFRLRPKALPRSKHPRPLPRLSTRTASSAAGGRRDSKRDDETDIETHRRWRM